MNILEACRYNQIKHLIFASSSSVYGLNTKMPLSTSNNVDHPISLYAATKKSNELMAHTYSHLFGLPTTGLRFFTVYGPWGRPDMAAQLFASAIDEGRPIKIFNEGKLSRDFTYIDDIVEGIKRVIVGPRSEKNVQNDFSSKESRNSLSFPPAGGIRQPGNDGASDGAERGKEEYPDRERQGEMVAPASNAQPLNPPYSIYNIGNGTPVKLMDFIETMENALGKKAEKVMLPMQAGDVYKTFADVSALKKDVDYAPNTTLKDGIGEFAKWYTSYYK